jgi:hypothetical protein
MDPNRAKHAQPIDPPEENEPAPDAVPVGVAPGGAAPPSRPETYTGPERRAQGYLVAEVIVETPDPQEDSSSPADPAH